MLDDESTDTPTSSTPESAAEAPAPAKKAPRKRASRAAAAPTPAAETAPVSDATAAAPAADTTSAADTTPAAGADADGEAEKPAKKPAKKAAPRKRTAKAVAPAAVTDAATDEKPAADAAEQAATPAEGTPAPEPSGPDAGHTAPADADAPAEPAKAARRRTRAPAVVVTFQAPEAVEPAPRTRRRAGTAGAVKPAELLAAAEDELTGLDAEAQAELEAAQLAAAEAEGAQTEDGEGEGTSAARRRRRGRRGRGRRPGEEGEEATDAEAETEDEAAEDDEDEAEGGEQGGSTSTRRRRRRRRSGGGGGGGSEDREDDVPTVVHVREPQARQRNRRDGGGEADEDGVRGISGSTRMAAKRVRRQEGRDSGRKRVSILTEAEFLARRESVDRQMVVRQKGDRTQIAVLEDGVLVEHYVTRATATSYAGNVYLGKVQNVLPSMEAAFVDVGKGRNAVLYAGEVNWEGVSGGQRKIELALKSGQEVLVQVTKDPIGHKGARLTSQISLPGRYLVYVPEGSMTGISRKLPENERTRLKNILKNVVPEGAGVIIRTAAEGASEEEIAADVRRLQAQWEVIKEKADKGGAPKALHTEPDLVIKVVRDIFNEDFKGLTVQGDAAWDTIREYVEFVAPDLLERVRKHAGDTDVFAEHRIDEQLLKALDRKVYLPSGGSLVIDRTEAMVVIDVNTGKYVGKGGNLEETVTRNNLEAAEEIARQLRLRDLGGIIVVDFIDMVLESNRDLVVRRLVECLGRDRTKHQVAEVTSLGLVQMTRKRVGQGLLESFSETCEACNGRGVKVHLEPVEPRAEKERDRTPKVGAKAPVPAGSAPEADKPEGSGGGRRRRRGGRGAGGPGVAPEQELTEILAGDGEELPGASDPAVEPARAEEGAEVAAEVAEAAAPEVSDAEEPAAEPAADEPVAAEPVADETVAEEPEATPDLADQPPTEVEDQPVLAAEEELAEQELAASTPAADVPDAETAAEPAAKRRRRAVSRPAGPPAV